MGAFHSVKKKPEISLGANVQFPIGKKLFHLVVNSGTSLCLTVDLELVQTTRNVMEHDIPEIPEILTKWKALSFIVRFHETWKLPMRARAVGKNWLQLYNNLIWR